MNKKYSYYSVKNFIENNSKCKLISTEYISIAKKLVLECECGEKFETTFDKFKNRNKRTCNKCSFARISQFLALKYNDVKRFVEKTSNSGCKLLSKEYVNSHELLRFQCFCGEIFETNLNSFKNGKQQCNKCGYKNYKKLDYNFLKSYIESFEYTVLYCHNIKDINSKTLFTLKCPNGHKYKVQWNNFQQGKRCPHCVNRYMTTDKFIETVLMITNGEYQCLGEYTKSNIHVLIQHNLCGHKYMVKPNNFMNGHRCPNCNNTSRGEKAIEEYLNKNNYFYIRQYKFNDCKNIFPLPFDFALFNNKNETTLLIEYDGKQHFEPVEHFGGIESFKKTIMNDSIKNDYCKQNNINLLRISYKNFKSIKKILDVYINGEFEDVLMASSF